MNSGRKDRQSSHTVISRYSRLVLSTAVIFLLFIIGTHTAFADLVVEKTTENTSYAVNDPVKVIMKFQNPFGVELPIKIVDKNIIGNNGLDVQCLEYTLPADKAVSVAYDDIVAYSAGDFTLDEAKVTYTDPTTKKEVTVSSKPVKVKVTGTATGSAQGITTLYRCGGVSMQSTSYSSSGSQNQQNQQQSEQQQQEQQQQEQRNQQSNQRATNNQINQDSNALKQQMQKQIEEQKVQQEEFKKNVAKDGDFQKANDDLQQQGFNISDGKFNAEANDTGSFELNYQSLAGENMTMKGAMENGTMKDLKVEKQEDKQTRLDAVAALKADLRYQRIADGLRKEGYSEQPPALTTEDNITKIEVPFLNNQSDGRSVLATFQDGKISDVHLQQKFPLLLAIGCFLLVAGFIALFVFRKKETIQEHKVEEKIDPADEARKLLEKAKKLFRDGHEKDAYELVSAAVRHYFQAKLGLHHDMTVTETVHRLKKEKHPDVDEVKECLHLCSMVEFAKYKANEKDFERILKTAKDVVK